MSGHHETGIAMTRSRARRREVVPEKYCGADRIPRLGPFKMSAIPIAAVEAYTSQIANFSSHARMTASGPPRARAATTAPKIGMKIAAVDGPKRSPTSVAAAIPITRSSNAAQPRSWNTLSAVGMNDPRRPRIGRRLTIVGTPARLPWWAAAASMMLPSTEPKSATIADSASVRPKPKPPTPIRSVPAARTSSPTPRLDHSTNTSKVRRTRNDGGTGSTPHSGGRRRRTIGRQSLCVYIGFAGRAATGLFLRLRELLVRMLERGDEREFFPREEIDERSAARAHVIDPVRQPELFARGDRASASDDREAVRLRDRGQELAGADRERLEFEDARRTVDEDRLRAADLVDVMGDRVQPDVVHRPFRREVGHRDGLPDAVVVQDHVHGPQDPSGKPREQFVAHRPMRRVIFDFPAHEVGRRLAGVDPRGIEEQVGDAPGREDAVDEVFLEHVPRDRDGVVRLHAPKEGDLRTLGLLDRLREHREFALHHATREGGQHIAEPDEARLRPMGCGERIEDEELRVGREPAHDVGLRHLLELRVRECLFLRIEAGVLG